MTSYDDTKVQLTINRMTGECYENVPSKSSTELYLISQDPTSIAKIDLDAQGAIESEISALSAQTLETFNQIENDISALSAWDIAQDSLISELSTQTISNSTDISALSVEIQEVSANMSKSIIRRWEPVAGLRFVAEEANSTVAMTAGGSAPSVSLEYNTGDGWNDFIVGTTTVTLANVGDECFIRAKTANTLMGSSSSNYNKFNMTGKIAASGSIMYLLKNDGDLDTIPSDYCFSNLFYNCRSLTTPPELPATTLADYCYSHIFEGCTSLTQSPELPSTALADYCYNCMFYGCTSLTNPPELPATSLANACYNAMFYGCSSLTQAPELPATTLQNYCYSTMFKDCTSLTEAPELPATTMRAACYEGMFKGCSGLITAPELPATTLNISCYRRMFQDCTSLNEIKIAYTGNFSGQDVPTAAFQDWVNGVSADGTFYYDGEDTTTGNSAIPTGWTVEPLTPSYQGLTFTAKQVNSTVAMTAVGSAPSVSLEYSTDGGTTWSDFIVDSTTITLANVGDKVFLRAKTTNTRMASDWNENNYFRGVGALKISGNINYLLNKNPEEVTSLPDYAFASLFYGYGNSQDSSFRDASELTLPATSLGQYCYCRLFYNCASLTQAPDLPATSLASNCYDYMFRDCTSLNSIKIGYTGNFSGTGVPSNAFNEWVNGVASSGTFYYNGSDTTRGTSAIPDGWTVQTF